MGFTVLDTFNRANATLAASPTSSSGGTWTVLQGIPTISSNTLIAGSADDLARIVAPSADGIARVTITAKGTQAGPMIRVTDALNYIRWVWSGADILIVKCVGGAFTVLATAAGEGTALTVGDTLALEARGSSLIGYRNGVQKATVSDAFNSSEVGIGFELRTGDAIDNMEWSA